MRYSALATDYDGTFAHHGVASDKTIEALIRVRESGRKTLLVTGRRLDDLFNTFSRVDVFDLIVAENGALLYEPATEREEVIAEAPPAEFAQALADVGVNPLDRGRVIVATLEDQKEAVLETITKLSLELQMIFNKGSLMILPAGVNKASGLAAALTRLQLSAHNVVGLGDAENDHAFLSACECGVAVANALDALKERADIVTAGRHGHGVIEIAEGMLENDLASFGDKLSRHDLLLGALEEGEGELKLPVFGTNLLIAGPSGAGKSTLMTGALERLVSARYQVCVLDPEGDYHDFPNSVSLGDAKHPAPIDGVLRALELPHQTVVVNMVGVPLENRPDYFETLLPRLADMQARVGRPHRIIADEVHHVAPQDRRESGLPEFSGLLAATMNPASIARPLLRKFDRIVAVGENAGKVIKAFAEAAEAGDVNPGDLPLERGEAALWHAGEKGEPVRFRVASCETPRTRHSRKYAEAVLTPDRSFYFRGPDQKLNLRASNLITFIQMMEGVDDDTFVFHLKGHEYSQWFRENIKNEELAETALEIEDGTLDPAEAKASLKRAIEERYTLPG